jgi:hypothetical protein
MMGEVQPMPNLHARALSRAAVIVGGADVLAVECGVPPEMLGRYLRGEAPVPADLFLKAAEIITATGVLDAAKSSSESHLAK